MGRRSLSPAECFWRAARCLLYVGLLIGLVGSAACQERERWPQQSETRKKPREIAPHNEEEVCPHGNFCIAATPGKVVLSPGAPFESCSVAAVLPADVASDMPHERRRTLRVRFDREVSERELAKRTSKQQRCCYFWFEDCT